MTPEKFLESCGWAKGAGPNFYLPNNGHPHIHLGLNGKHVSVDDVGNSATYQNKKTAYGNLKPTIDFIAISNGTRGVNLIRNGRETKEIKNALGHLDNVSGIGERAIEMRNELHYILESYGF